MLTLIARGACAASEALARSRTVPALTPHVLTCARTATSHPAAAAAPAAPAAGGAPPAPPMMMTSTTSAAAGPCTAAEGPSCPMRVIAMHHDLGSRLRLQALRAASCAAGLPLAANAADGVRQLSHYHASSSSAGGDGSSSSSSSASAPSSAPTLPVDSVPTLAGWHSWGRLVAPTLAHRVVQEASRYHHPQHQQRSLQSMLAAQQQLPRAAVQQQWRRQYGYALRKRRFRLPANIAAAVKETVAALPRRRHRLPRPTLEARPLLEASQRVGVIATKAGMTQDWDEHGVRVPLTVLWIDECQVVGIKTPEINGYYALQLGAGYKRQKCMDPARAGWYLKAGVPFKKLMAEWRVSPDALLPVGTPIRAPHFVAGQRVDVAGWTKRKGFQGVMKRWGFKGLPASHGVSLSHRHPGSIGNRQDPGRVWKGRKLPGHMGNERRTVHNVLVYKVDPARNLLYVRGQVPGPAGKSVLLRDGRYAKHAVRSAWGLPFPTHIPGVSPGAAAEAAEVTVAKSSKDPYLMYREETDYQPIQWKKGD